MTDASPDLDRASAHDRFVAVAERIATTVAGPHSSEVDAEARFPRETVEALREARLLSALVPVEQGGLGATLTDVSAMIRIISRHCAASGCVLAMHSSDVYCLLRHGTTPPLQALVADIVDRQLLVANATSEIKIDGVSAALSPEPGGFFFDKHVLASSYGLHADLITSTIRSAQDAAETDQVIGVFPTAELSLVPISEWNTLGMRGTCSRGLHITGHIDAGDLYPQPYSTIANGAGQSIHVLLTAVWMGLAEAALEDAQVKVRADSRKSIDAIPQSATRLAELLVGVQAARSTLAQGLVMLEAAARENAIDDPAVLTALRNVKLVTTTTAVSTATLALQICGVPGYQRGQGHRLERVIRDSFGGLVMLSNDRLLSDNAAVLRLMKSI